MCSLELWSTDPPSDHVVWLDSELGQFSQLYHISLQQAEITDVAATVNDLVRCLPWSTQLKLQFREDERVSAVVVLRV